MWLGLPLLPTDVEVGLHRDRLLHQRADAAVVGDHQHAGRGLRRAIDGRGHVEGARVHGVCAAVAAVATGRAAAITARACATHACAARAFAAGAITGSAITARSGAAFAAGSARGTGATGTR